MTPEIENVMRNQGRQCADEIRRALKAKPKPKWNEVIPPILKKHHEKIKPHGHQSSEICQCYWPHEWAVWSGLMKERGMIFNGEMVRALLDGRKTQTRRIVKGTDGAVKFCPECDINGEDIFVVLGEKDHTGMNPVLGAIACPFGTVGDRIWVRETWAEAVASAPDLKLYRANYPDHVPSHYENVPPADEIRWTPSIHMPRWASRILLEITDVRVERLKNISDGDAIREGCSVTDMKSGDCVADVFARLWESIYGAESWQANPWVWVIEFKRVEGGAA